MNHYFSELTTIVRRLGVMASLTSMAIVFAATGKAAEHVVHISVDGLRPSFLQQLIDTDMAPNFKRFQTEGAWTNNARTDFTHTITLPNHTSMVTGRPVSQPAGAPNTLHHGWVTNSDPSASATLHNSGNLNVPYKASTWDVAHDAGLSTAHFASKSKFIIYEQSFNAANGATHPNGKDKIDTFFAQENASATMQTQMLAALGTTEFNYTFLHYADPDIVGHSSGWGGTAYMNAVKNVDGYLGQLFSLLETDAGLVGKTAIVLSADHGGSGTDHSTPSTLAHYTIPFYVWGDGVDHGDLYAMNIGTRTNPGTGRPDYNAAGQPIRNGDGGNLALSLLGLGAIPGSLINAQQDLRVEMPVPEPSASVLVGGLALICCRRWHTRRRLRS